MLGFFYFKSNDLVLFNKALLFAAIILPPSLGSLFSQVFIEPPALLTIGINALISQEFNPVSIIKSMWPSASKQY
jgi:hypothetical protein